MNTFNKDCRSFFGDSGLHCPKIIKRHVFETLYGWFKPLLDLFLSCGRDACQGSAMKRIFSGNNLITSIGVTVESGDFIQTFVSLGPAITKKHFPVSSCMLNEFFSQQTLWLGIVKIGNMRELPRLFGKCRS